MSSDAERSFVDLLAGLAERSPTPGAGCAVAWAGALAAGLLEMVAGFADNAGAAARAPVLRQELLAAGERELVAYAPVLSATTQEARDRALSEASDAPLAIARASAEVADLAAHVMAESKPALRGDATAGVILAEAATRAAVELVAINLRAAPGDPRLAEAAQLRERAARARGCVEA